MDKIPASNGTSNRAEAFGSVDYIKITIFGLALTALWSSLHSIVLPLRVLDFVTPSEKTLWFGLLNLVGLAIAMVVQPIAGAISDRSDFGWGRRRPYVLMGTILAMLFLPGVGLAGSYAALFLIYCLLQISGNIAQGPYQALIPDLVPRERRGAASGVKTLLEVIGGVALVRLIAYFMSHYFAGGEHSQLWLALGVLAIVLLGTMLATILMVAELPWTGSAQLPLMSALKESFRIDVKASPNFVLFLVSRFLILTALATLQRYALFFLMDVVAVADPVSVAADLNIVVGVCLLAVVYPAGKLSDWLGRRSIIVFSGPLGALGVVVLLFSQGYGFILLSGVILGIASGAFMSANWALATDLVADGEAARYLGLTNLATAGSGTLVGLMGLVIYFFNIDIPGLGYQIMLLACFGYFLVGSLLLMKIRPPRQPK